MNSAVTRILARIEAGDRSQAAAAELLPLVYEELRRLADARLARERPGQTLQATALVHEAYVRLLGPEGVDGRKWDGRGHFFGAAAEAMRRILIDRARARNADKRGGGEAALGEADITLDGLALTIRQTPEALLELDAAMEELAKEDPQKAELVRLRFYAGLTLEQAGSAMGLSAATADRWWAYARAWLYARVGGG